jgi:FkbH-like protein
MPPEEPRAAIVVGATFTAEAMQPVMDFWIRELGLDCELRFAPYNQVFQQLLDPSSALARNSGGVNVLLIRFRDWSHGPSPVEQNVDSFVEALRTFTAPVILALCPDAPAHLEQKVRTAVTAMPWVHLITPAETAALYCVADPHDPAADELGHVPYTSLYFAALGTMVMRKIHAIRTPPYKVVALDCDDTLWRGICGEDGPRGVVIDPPRRALQKFMLARRESGMLLTLCTKNNEDDVVETFRVHPEMPLTLDDFIARRINWEPKSTNLAALAGELNLGLDAFILVDDNPKECNEVQAAAPEVMALALPADAAQIPTFLDHVWAFDRARVTEEDRSRSTLYAQQAERERLKRSSASLQKFLESLRLEVRITPAEAGQVARIAQLTQRTNQMNTTTIRRSEGEVERLLKGEDAQLLVVDVRDRFGSYGLTGLAVYRFEPAVLVVDSLLLSCRVLGRGVEHHVLAKLGGIALERGLERVEFAFQPTARNQPARLFLEEVAEAKGDRFVLPASAAAAARYRPSSKRSLPKPPAPPAARRKAVNYARIATELRTPEQIISQLQPVQRPASQNGSAAARSPLERELAELWSKLLGVPSVGVHDSFFDLGGHSLLAVQLLARVRQIYGVELSLEVVYSGPFTVAELANAIVLKEIELVAGSEYQSILEELESLSEEEARALLEQEQDAP